VTTRLPTIGVIFLTVGLAFTASMMLATMKVGLHPDVIGLHAGEADLLAGRPMYSTFVEGTLNLNPPHILLALLPLGLMPLPLTAVAWWILSVVSGLWCLHVWRTLLPTPWPLFVLAAALVTFGGYSAGLFASWAWPLAALMASAYAAQANGRAKTAGVLLGLVASCRVFALLFVPYLCWRREWRTLTAMGITALVFWGAGLIIAGPAAYVSWFSALNSITWQADPYNVSLLGLSARLFTVTPFGPFLASPEWTAPVWILLCGVVGLLTLRRVYRSRNLALEWTAVILLGHFFSPLAWGGYLLMLAGPLAICWRHFGRGAVLCVAIACLSVPTRAIALALPPSWLVGITIGSLHLWAALALWAYCCFIAPRDSSSAASDLSLMDRRGHPRRLSPRERTSPTPMAETPRFDGPEAEPTLHRAPYPMTEAS
jgi:hypothetical protein